MKALKKIRCWWFGCEAHPQDPAPPEFLECIRCGEIVDYADQVGYTRHTLVMGWASYWLFRKWWPKKCLDCGRRWKCDNSEHIPF